METKINQRKESKKQEHCFHSLRKSHHLLGQFHLSFENLVEFFFFLLLLNLKGLGFAAKILSDEYRISGIALACTVSRAQNAVDLHRAFRLA